MPGANFKCQRIFVKRNKYLYFICTNEMIIRYEKTFNCANYKVSSSVKVKINNVNVKQVYCNQQFNFKEVLFYSSSITSFKTLENW